MVYLAEQDVRRRARQRARAKGMTPEDALKRIAAKSHDRYDIFLSQTIRDAEIVLGVYDILTDLGYAVFCDWVDSHEFDREEVTPANAMFIRDVMGRSATLLFIDTQGARQSQWMCWELGWFDGENGHVAVLPVLPDGTSYYQGREFLGLYPVVEVGEDGNLIVVRPAAVTRFGLMFEAPNSRRFDRWAGTAGDDMRPRVYEKWRP